MTRVALLALALTATAADPPASTRAERWAKFKAAREAFRLLVDEENKAAQAREDRDKSASGLRVFSAEYAAKQAAIWRDIDFRTAADVLAFAEQFPADDIGCEAAAYAVGGLHSQPEQLDRCRAILRRHPKNPLIHDGLHWLAVKLNPADDQFLRAVLADNPDRSCRGYACALLGVRAQLRADNPVPDAEATACREAARGWFQRAINEFGDDKRERTELGSTTLAEFAARGLKALDAETLVGRPAPPLKGTDLHAQPFDLADHRGKVVLVLFWGQGWDAATAPLVPHLKAAATKLAGRPFAVVGAWLDNGKASVGQRTATRLGMSWPSLHPGEDGSTFSTLAVLWQVRGFPTLYLVGPDGVVRRRLVGVTEPALLVKLAEENVDRVGR